VERLNGRQTIKDFQTYRRVKFYCGEFKEQVVRLTTYKLKGVKEDCVLLHPFFIFNLQPKERTTIMMENEGLWGIKAIRHRIPKEERKAGW